ncbi:malto-oligosyltrehalose synthase [Phyllobacterium endophyticum]|uniref:malto-oligosyltrehalose synthase n=1 Tax=Phyllobacterium endophyticum TaxID=1149773 RepID=UPI00164FDBD6|nr:malto-oligosyltrehalose synthase [Phyllobacterium endophyticum]
MTRMTTPISAYRIQLRNGLSFSDIAAIVPYLNDLGIDTLTVSPIFSTIEVSSGKKSYNPTKLDGEAGGEYGFAVLDTALRKLGMGLVVDINPNQMPATHHNPWWFDVLEWGSESRYAGHFDVDWKKRLTLPVLQRPLVEEVQAETLQLHFHQGKLAFGITYGDVFYPLHPRSYEVVLRGVGNALSIDFLDAANKADAQRSEEFHFRLREIYESSELAHRLELAAWLKELSQDMDAIDKVLSMQKWRLMTRQKARRRMNYRHAFDSVHSVGVQVEKPQPFKDFHEVPLDLLEISQIIGFRVNQIDGLADPEAYLRQLRANAGENAYLVTDKILLDGEKHPALWHADGTAGYEFISATANVLIDHDKLAALEKLYSDIGGPGLLHYRGAKSAVLHRRFAAELQALVDLIISIDPDAATGLDLTRAVTDLVIELPVFRTYSDGRGVLEPYRSILRSTISEIKSRADATDARALEFVQKILETSDSLGGKRARFITKFQQLTAAVMAQAIEQSHRYGRGPIALDEVILHGADSGDPVQAFHDKMLNKAAAAPRGMLATTFSYTTKFGEDARMRLLALSEAPEPWCEAVLRWRQKHAQHVATIEETPAPDPQTEWLIFQTLAAIWPLTLPLDDETGLNAVREDLSAFIQKAISEIQRDAFWTEINRPYELAVMDYINQLFADRSFLQDFVETMRPFWVAGAINSFSQTVLKATAPGVAVVYNGAECWDFGVSNIPASTDVNFEALATRLSYADQSPLNILLEDWHTGAIKQRLVSTHLRARKRKPGLFTGGEYVPLKVTGKKRRNVIAFLRKDGSDVCMVAVPRHPFDAVRRFNTPFMPIPGWGDTAIQVPQEIRGLELQDLMTGNRTILADKCLMADAMRGFSTVSLMTD